MRCFVMVLESSPHTETLSSLTRIPRSPCIPGQQGLFLPISWRGTSIQNWVDLNRIFILFFCQWIFGMNTAPLGLCSFLRKPLTNLQAVRREAVGMHRKVANNREVEGKTQARPGQSGNDCPLTRNCLHTWHLLQAHHISPLYTSNISWIWLRLFITSAFWKDRISTKPH